MHHQIASPVASSIIVLTIQESFLREGEEVQHRTIECQVVVILGEGLTNGDHREEAIDATQYINNNNMIVSTIGSFSAINAIS